MRRRRALRSMSRQLVLLDWLLARPRGIAALAVDLPSPPARQAMQLICVERASRLRQAAAAALDVVSRLRGCPVVRDGASAVRPRVVRLAEDYLAEVRGEFDVQGYAAFLRRVQERTQLSVDELELALPAIRLVCLLRVRDHLVQTILGGAPAMDAVRSPAAHLFVLDLVDRQPPEPFIRELCPFESLLERDPAGCYRAMDSATKRSYRRAVESLARSSRVSPSELVQRALTLAARGAGITPSGDPRGDLGFYLLGPGHEALLRSDLHGRRPSRHLRGPSPASVAPLSLALLGLTAVITTACSRVWELSTGSEILDLAVVFLLSALAFEVAWKVLEVILLWRRPARTLPAMDFDGGIPDDAATLVCVPALLTSLSQVEELAGRLEAHRRDDPDRNVRFALLTDWLDSDREQPTPEEVELLDRCAARVEELNRRDGARDLGPFYLLHRARVWSDVQRCWMGQGRKAGKLQALNRFIVDGSDEFARVVGHVASLRSIRYVLVLDEDASAAAKSIRRLVGAIHHPLNRPRRPDELAPVQRGYGIVVSPVLARPASLAGWKRPGLFLQSQPVATEGATIRPRRNVYFDLFGQRMFAGKGIYDVRLAGELLADRFSLDRMLSHDVMEGGILRTAFFDRAALLDDFPASYTSYCARQHRWLRGDWQNLGLLARGSTPTARDRGARVPPFLAFLVLNNVRISTIVVCYAALAAMSVSLDPTLATQRLIVVVALPLMPSYLALAAMFLHRLARGPMLHEIRDWWRTVREVHSRELMRLLTAPHQALLTLDAMLTASYRMISGRNLLEWNPSSLVANGARRARPLTAHLHAAAAASAALAVYLVAGARMTPVALVVLGLWALAPYAIRKLV
jgi:hypothetical protein